MLNDSRITLENTYETSAGNNDMVVQVYTKQLRYFGEPARNLVVGYWCLQTSARVVVGDDDAGGAIGDGVGEDFAWVDQASGERADGDDTLGNQAVSPIERKAYKVFLLFVADVGELRNGLFRRVDDWPLYNFKLPSPELVSRHELRGFGERHTFYAH